MAFFNRNWLLASLLCLLIGVAGSVPCPAAAESGNQEAVALDLGAATFSKLTAGEKILLHEYHDNYVRVARFYRNVTMEVKETSFVLARSAVGIFPAAPTAGLEIEAVRDCVFRARDGSHFRMDGNSYDATDLTVPTTSRIGIISPSESFLLGRSTSNGTPYLIAHGKDREEYLSALSVYYFHIAPFGLGALPLEYRIFADQGCTVDKVAVEDSAGEEIASIFMSGETPQVATRWKFRFYRNRCWAAKEVSEESSYAESPGRIVRERQFCEYEGASQEVPLLRRCIWEQADQADESAVERIVHRRVFEVAKLTPGAPPLAEFNVNQFVGTVLDSTKSTFSTFRVVCIINGFLLVLIGVYLHRRSRAKTRLTSGDNRES